LNCSHVPNKFVQLDVRGGSWSIHIASKDGGVDLKIALSYDGVVPVRRIY
jgi:hypothetical protein